MKSFLIVTTLVCLVITGSSNNVKAQSIGVGGFIGGGFIGGESPNIGSFNTSLFIDVNPGFSDFFLTRFSFIYAGDFDNILPGTRYDYFPFMRGVSLKGIVMQDYADDYFLEEGIGVIYLNDRTFSSTNAWNFGVVFSLAGGIDLIKNKVRAGVGTEYAFGFGGTFPKYFTVYVQTKYTL